METERNALRAALAARLSAMYAEEVPKYGHLVDATNRINADRGDGYQDQMRLGGERHGAVRVASFDELARMAKLFRIFGMEPVGYYDLRTAAIPIPVVSTAFRPITKAALDASPFRMFTSVLVDDDDRFFTSDLTAELRARDASRQLFPEGLDELLDQPENQHDGDTLLDLAVEVFRLDPTPFDDVWHQRLDAVSPVAADIAAGRSTHLNHLTPRVVDIEALHQLMTDEGVEMIEKIQGPPAWAGPNVLLRQTSFRALDETRNVITEDGTSERTVRVRFGEVEQRGIALTPQGRAKVDAASGDAAVLGESLAHTIEDLARDGDAYVRFVPTGAGNPNDLTEPWDLVDAGVLGVEPITYEDFLPASAAGIFASNLAHDGTTITDSSARLADGERLRSAVGTLRDPYALYAAEQAESLRATAL